MSSGNKQMVYNTRERLVSDDHTREQQFIGADVSSVLAHLFLTAVNGDAEAGGVETLPATTSSPLKAAVLSGLRVLPINGTTSTLVQPGSLVVVDPDGTPKPDDVPYKWIVDPGVQLAGQLTLTPGSGSTRVDVIECSRTEAVIESDNRDVFNPSTGLFAPVLVDKVVVGRLAYRIRTGTPGAGFPGTASGWLPLAVLSVPSTATTFDQVDIWDVRPLVSDRDRAPFVVSADPVGVRRCHVWTDSTTAPGEVRVYGLVEGALNGYRVGGQLASDAGDYLDVADADYKASGYSFPTDAWWHLWLAFPFGLPRWVRYSGAGLGSRAPRGPRGIPCLSAIASRWNGTPSSTGVALPAWTGLSATTTDALLVLSGWTDNTGAPYGVTSDGEKVQATVGALGLTVNGHYVDTTTVEGSNTYVTFTLTDGVTHPANAKAVWLWCSISVNYLPIFGSINETNAISNYYFRLSEPGGTDDNTSILCGITGVNNYAYIKNGYSPNNQTFSALVRVPLAAKLSAPSTTRTFLLTWYVDTNPDATVGAPKFAQTIGWEV